MGLLRDAIGSALGAGQINNGLSGPKLPFAQRRNRETRWLSSSDTQQSPYPDQRYGSYTNENNGRNCTVTMYPGPEARQPYEQMQQRDINARHQFFDEPPCYENFASQRGYDNQRQFNDSQPRDITQVSDFEIPGGPSFRPLALPQIGYGDEQPFLRAYSSNLSQYGISELDFIKLIDAINVAIIPNPENQIFQKGANIAGWFLPGAAGIGLTLGQIGVGLGTSLGHASAISRVLSSANLQVFLPRGLEICIGKTQDVEATVGLNVSPYQRQDMYGLAPEQRQMLFGDLVAPLSRVLPPLQQSGRNDPVAMIGRSLASRTNQKKIQKAEKDMAKGKNKSIDALQGGMQWVSLTRPLATS
ncbi:hypothetical protein PoHVEF18_010243 [Penicillium ochrochloron]